MGTDSKSDGFYTCEDFGTADAFFECASGSETAIGSWATSSDATSTCHKVDINCIRFKVTFQSNPGNLPGLITDTADVTVNGKTDAQDGTTGINGGAGDVINLVSSGDTTTYTLK